MKRRLGLVALVALLVMSCAALPEGPSPTDPPAVESTISAPLNTVTTISPEEGAGRFRDCLGDEGIDIEPIPFDAQGRPRLDLVLRDVDFTLPGNAAVLDSCSLHLITGALDLTDSPLISDRVLSQLAEFGDCMRDRGVPGFPQTVRGFSGVGSPFPVDEIPYADPDLATAAEVCRQRLAGG